MLVIVVVLLIFGAVVRHKWKNAAAKKEEILRLLAAASHEEAEIAKLQAVDFYESPHPTPTPTPPPLSMVQIQKRYYCAVCFSPTTTRCSKCKAVRYCSGKCQIIHWRQGHKDECRPPSSLHESKGSASAVETASQDQLEINSVEDGMCSVPTEHLDDSESSSSSLHCFSSSSEHSETSFDASSSGTSELGTPFGPNKVAYEGVDCHTTQSTSDSDESGVPSVSPLNSTVQAVHNKPLAKKIEKSEPTKRDGRFQATSNEGKGTGNGAAMSKDVAGAIEVRSSQSSDSSETSSFVENHAHPACLSSDVVTKSMYTRRSGSRHQGSVVVIKNSPCSKSPNTTTKEDFLGNEVELPRSKDTISLSSRSSENDEIMSSKTGSAHTLLSESEGAQTSSPPTSKALKTSTQKLFENFRVSKQSKSSTFDIRKDSAGKYNHKIIFPPELFMQLYSCDGVELHPVGLINCGNSCYANAVLQCLTFTRPIAAYLLQGLHSKTCRKRDWCLICEFERLIQKGQKIKSPSSPVGILSQIEKIGSHLSHGRQEDAHDFLRNVTDAMQSIWLEEADVSGSLAEDSTLLGLTFGGYLRSRIKCMKCSGRSEQYDRMMDLSVEIDGDISTLEQALAQFTISEILAGDDKYKCSRCMSYEKAEKQLTVVEAPNVLTIVLKRFRSGNLEKLNKLVRFPEVLNLAPYMSGMSDKYPMYHLYGVIVHLNMLNAAYSGHYISYVKDFRGEWFRIDDSRVSHVRLETVLSVEAYILFYARQAPQGPSSLTNNSVHSDRKPRSMEAVPSSGSAKKKNLKAKQSCSYAESMAVLHQRHPIEITSSHAADYDEDRVPPITDSSSDSSSIFSVSDAGSCSTDSTKDSNAEDISGSTLHQPSLELHDLVHSVPT